jgi:hypothetical protein
MQGIIDLSETASVYIFMFILFLFLVRQVWIRNHIVYIHMWRLRTQRKKQEVFFFLQTD